MVDSGDEVSVVLPEQCRRVFSLRRPSDAVLMRSELPVFLRRIVASPQEALEIATAAMELGTNVVRHGQGGEVTVVVRGGRDGIVEVCAVDRGPGFDDVRAAVEDGVSRGRRMQDLVDGHLVDGLGVGLGTVERLMGPICVSPRQGGGVSVSVSRRVRLLV